MVNILTKSFKLLFSNLIGGGGGGGGMLPGGGGGGGGGEDGGPLLPIIIGGIGLGIFTLVKGCDSCNAPKSTSYNDKRSNNLASQIVSFNFLKDSSLQSSSQEVETWQYCGATEEQSAANQ